MTYARPRQRRGFVLIVALVVTFAIASLVITLGRVARTESQASANQLAGYEAAAVERGAEQYVLAMLANNVDTLGDLDDTDWAQVPVGTGYFWVVRPDYLDDDLPQFGLVDEAAKIPLNQVSATNLQTLPDMDQDTATAIADWRTGTSDTGSVNTGGEGYRVKGGKYESVEEMLMVKGVTRQFFFGDDALTRMGQAAPTTLTGNDAMRAAGWQNYFTAWETMTTQTAPNQPIVPQIAINTAPSDVIACLLGMESTAVDNALAARKSAIDSNPDDVTWAQTAFPGVPNGQFVLHSNKFSADIVAAAGNGRAFRRVRIVVDATTAGAPQIVYRRDITGDGFPLDATVLQSLRDGTFVAGGTSSTTSSRGGKL